MKKLIPLCLSLAFLAGCAHHRDVRAGADGIHRVVVKSEDGDEGAQNAIKQANHFCEQHGKTAAFIAEDKKYTGDMDEETYKNVKTASKVAKTVGGFGYVFGGNNERNAGGIIGLGGIVADKTAGQGYTIEMKFKCTSI